MRHVLRWTDHLVTNAAAQRGRPAGGGSDDVAPGTGLPAGASDAESPGAADPEATRADAGADVEAPAAPPEADPPAHATGPGASGAAARPPAMLAGTGQSGPARQSTAVVAGVLARVERDENQAARVWVGKTGPVRVPAELAWQELRVGDSVTVAYVADGSRLEATHISCWGVSR